LLLKTFFDINYWQWLPQLSRKHWENREGHQETCGGWHLSGKHQSTTISVHDTCLQYKTLTQHLLPDLQAAAQRVGCGHYQLTMTQRPHHLS
jgi:hypothetical protein